MNEQIDLFLSRNNGQITVSDMKKLGLNPHTLADLARTEKLERVARGIYVKPEVFEDELYVLQFRFNKGIYYKDTALFLHNLIDRTPGILQMNFPIGYNAPAIKDYPVKVYRQKSEWYEIGVEEVRSPGNHLVRVYNVERTLCDILRQRDQSDSETIRQAMIGYVQLQDKNLDRLSEYANKFNITDKINPYLEVLL